MQKSGLSMETHPHHIYIYVSLLLQFVRVSGFFRLVKLSYQE